LIGGAHLRSIAKQSGTSATALLRHKRDHLPTALAQSKQAREVAHGDNLIAQMRKLDRRTTAILDKAEKAGNLETALKAIGEVRRNQELLGVRPRIS